MVLEGLKCKLRNNFNISILEIDNIDKWQKSTIALANVAKNKKYANRILSKIVDSLQSHSQLQLLDYEMEFI